MNQKRMGGGTRPRKSSKDYSEKKSVDADPALSQRAMIEKSFLQFSDGKKTIEIYRLRQLLKR